MEQLDTWVRAEFTADGTTRDVYRKGSGTGVIIIHEIPGIEPDLVAFAEEVVARGHTVVLPHLFGTPGAGFGFGNMMGELRQFCVRREFTLFARGRTSPVAGWLRALARDLHAEAGGDGIGVVGLCFTGGFALAMMVDAPVIAPVLAEPSLPFPLGAARGADLGLSSDDLSVVKEKAAAGCEVLGLRYRTDSATGTRFDSLRRELGDKFLAVEFEGPGHSVLTAHRREYGVDRVLDFFDEKLDGTAPMTPARDVAEERALEAALPPGFEAQISGDPKRVLLFVERGVTASGRERIETTTRTLTGVNPEIVRVTP